MLGATECAPDRISFGSIKELVEQVLAIAPDQEENFRSPESTFLE